MTEWTTYIATRRDSPEGGGVSEANLFSFVEALEDQGGVVAGGKDGYDATITVEAPNAAEAITTGTAVVTAAAVEVGLPNWAIVHVEAIETNEHDRQLEQPTHPALVGVTEIAEMLEVSKQRVDQLIRERDDFPAPLARLAAGPVWDQDAIRVFEERWPRQTGRPRRVSATR